MADIDNDTSYPVTTSPASTDQVVIINKATGLLAKTAFSNAHKGLTLPVCSLGMTAVQELANTVATAIVWDYENCDPDNLHSNSTANTKIIIATAGIYYISSYLLFAADADGTRILDIYINGATYAQNFAPGSASGTVVHVSTVRPLAATDYVEVYGTQNAGGALNVGGANSYKANFSVFMIRAGSFTAGGTT